MEMHQARYFLAVCEAQNFTRAAEACNVAQPSLTKAIKKLEEEFEGALFFRERNHTILTELGRRVFPHIQMLVSANEAAHQDASNFHSEDAVTIKLGVMSTIAPTRMIGFLARLRQEIPGLSLDVREASGTDLIAGIEAGELDVGLIAMPMLPDALTAMPLYDERYVLAFPEGHGFGRENTVPLSALAGVDYLKRVHCEFTDYFQASGKAKPLGVNVRYSSEREDWVQAMVVAGLGCSIMPEYLPEQPGIGTRPITDPEISRTVSLVTVAGRRHGPALGSMVRLAKRFAWPGKA